jgi:hypothetical protein
VSNLISQNFKLFQKGSIDIYKKLDTFEAKYPKPPVKNLIHEPSPKPEKQLPALSGP